VPLELRLDVVGNGIPSVATGLGSGALVGVGRSAELISGALSGAEAPNDGGEFIDGAVYDGVAAGSGDVLGKFAGSGLVPSG